MRTLPILARGLIGGVLALSLIGCGNDDDQDVGADAPDTTEAPQAEGKVVVTTNVLGDVVSAIVGDDAEVEVIMPPGSDPHDFAPSARQAASMREADLLIVNGAGFEEGLLSAIEGAEEDGVPVHEAISAIDTIELEGGHSHDDGADDDHGHGHDDEPAEADDDHGHSHDDDHDHDDDEVEVEGAHDDGDDHGNDGEDPHFFTDPSRMAAAVEGMADALVTHVESLDTDEFRARVDDYIAELTDLDAEVEATLEAVPAERRVLVTNHDVFGYFADRYDFEVLGAVIPGGSTLAEPSAADLAALATAIEAEGVPAVFVDASAPSRLADALAAEAGIDVEVVELFTESLGAPGSGGETYLDMVRANAERIAAALS
jgi:zinc/manganese transport system substrate-binding protein